VLLCPLLTYEGSENNREVVTGLIYKKIKTNFGESQTTAVLARVAAMKMPLCRIISARALGKERFQTMRRDKVINLAEGIVAWKSDVSSDDALPSNPVHFLPATVNQKIKPKVF
jgi:hypothetical protein